MMASIEEFIPENEIKSEVEESLIRENIIRTLRDYISILDETSANDLIKIAQDAEIEEIYDRIDTWFNLMMNPDNPIKALKGYQNSNPDFKKSGIIIGYNGMMIDINNLRPEYFSKHQQARSLSREARYCGNTHKPYYVAQHCVVGAEFFLLMGRPDLARIFIRHEGGESILRDMTKPVKDLLPDYEALQERLDRYNAEVHGLPWPFPPEIKQLDRNCAQYEMTFMMSIDLHTDYWTSEVAEARFIETWDKIEYIINTYYQQDNQ